MHDEDPEILGLWAAALNTDGYEVDVVPAQSAIEGCELHLDELEPESLYLVPPPTFEERR